MGVNLVGRVATMFFTKDWNDSVRRIAESEIAQTAKHEMLHLLLSRLSELAVSRYVTEDQITEAEEELVRKLEGLLERAQ